MTQVLVKSAAGAEKTTLKPDVLMLYRENQFAREDAKIQIWPRPRRHRPGRSGKSANSVAPGANRKKMLNRARASAQGAMGLAFGRLRKELKMQREAQLQINSLIITNIAC